MYLIGVDLGGTNIKAGIVDEGGTIIRSHSMPTSLPRSSEAVSDDILALIDLLLEKEALLPSRIDSIGIGSPGIIHPRAGRVVYSNNLDWHNFPLVRYIKDRFSADVPVYLANDANAAALGEYACGSAKGTASAVVLTIGTGLGSGIIIHSKMLEGHFYGGGECGHMVIQHGGKPCTCGRKGCWEAYASATGLINLTKDELVRSPGSIMHRLAEQEGKISGRTAFEAMRHGDAAGARVVDLFIDYLACGIVNVINCIQPETICIGGGVSKEGDTLLTPLREKVTRECYGNEKSPVPELRICSLGNDAGIIGAAMLGLLNKGAI